MWTRDGEDITEIMIGMDTGGTMNRSLTGDSGRTGVTGMTIDIGKEKGPGASGNIDVRRNTSYGSREVLGSSNINRDPRFSDTSNGCGSIKNSRRLAENMSDGIWNAEGSIREV